MYAIINCGSKQYKVSTNETIKVEKISKDIGNTIEIKEVSMLVDDNQSYIGKPFIENAFIKAEIVEQIRDKKVIIFKKKRRQNYRRKNGHRQYLTVLRILEIGKTN